MKRIEWGLALLLLACCVWPAVDSSLWLDEAGSWWIVKDGLQDAVARSLSWSASSPFYYSVLWGAVQLFGLSELGLRLPSILFTLSTILVLYRLALRWFDTQGARITVVLFLCIPAVQFTVVDARPYALGLLLLVSSWLTFMRWIEHKHWRRGLLFVLCAASTVWVHYTVALGLLPLALCLPQLGWRNALAATAGGLLLLFPLAAQVADTVARREILSWAPPPSALALLASTGVVFWFPIAVLSAASISHQPVKGYRRIPSDAGRPSLAPIILLAFGPPLLLFIASWLNWVQLFAPRYFVTKEIGLAVLCAWLIMQLPIPKFRTIAALVQVLIALTFTIRGLQTHGAEGWRESSEWIRAEVASAPHTKIVVVSGFVESLQSRYLEDPAYRGILLAPQTVYPVPGSPVLLPWKFSEDTRLRIKSTILTTVDDANSIILVSLPLHHAYEAFVKQHLEVKGLRLVETRRFERVQVLLFQKALPSQPL